MDMSVHAKDLPFCEERNPTILFSFVIDAINRNEANGASHDVTINIATYNIGPVPARSTGRGGGKAGRGAVEGCAGTTGGGLRNVSAVCPHLITF